MFYVFYVNEGFLQPLEVSVALGSVHKLQCAIEEVIRVPIAEQALLVSGGEGLQVEKQVSHYQGAGTESNPVFLFRKLYREDNQNPGPTDNDEFFTLCAGLYDELRILNDATISRSLVTRYCDVARLGLKVGEIGLQFCARLVQDHQLLHQGWLALVSNLCESRTQIDKKSERFFSRYERLKTMRTKAESLLQDFDSVVRTLQQIKIPSSLLSNSYKLQGVSKVAEECTLYEYIARADPQNSLEEMSEQVNILFSKTNDTEYNQVISNMKYVNDHVSNPEMRNIRGINTRLTQLDSMFHSKEQQMKALKDLCTAISQPVPDSQSARDVVLNQREKMSEAKKLIVEMQKMGRAFQQSKIELLKNIRLRLRRWILQVYDKLHTTNNQITLFEEKYIALRNRLDIIRQVKESPIMYATALTESLRRSVLQPEFESWYILFMEKSCALVTEETTVREVFKQKLGRHFLKHLFPGMFDGFPDFAPSGLTRFDQNLPPVTPADLRALRQAVPYLANLLRVTDPYIYQRLSVRDPRITSDSQAAPLKREESFYTTDATINIANLNKNFPSTHWLSGDENLDVSPSNAAVLAKSPPSRFNSTMSLDIVEGSPSKPLNPLSCLFTAPDDETVEPEVEIEGEAYTESCVPKSEPIAIPQSSGCVRQAIASSVEEKSPAKLCDAIEKSQSRNPLYLQDILKKLSLELRDFKQEMVIMEKQAKEFLDEVLIQITDVVAFAEQIKTVVSTDQLSKHYCWDAEIKTEVENKNVTENILKGNGTSECQQPCAEITAERMKVEGIGMYEGSVSEHELTLECEAASHIEELKRKDKEIILLKTALHKLRETDVHHDAEIFGTATTSDEIRVDHEIEDKNKTHLLLTEIEEKKKEEIAKIRKEAYLDFQLQLRKYEERIADLENLLADKIPLDVTKKSRMMGLHKGSEKSPNKLVDGRLLNSFIVHDGTRNEAEGRDLEKDGSEDDSEAQGDFDEDIAPVTVRPAAVQTTISLREMRTMITVQDIHEFCAVLVVWSEPHNAYILFSVSPVFHFVKESSLRRMGVKLDRQPVGGSLIEQRPNWLMALTTRLELCKIRKADNRYNLKVGTKFYRVEVEPLQIDLSSIRRHVDE